MKTRHNLQGMWHKLQGMWHKLQGMWHKLHKALQKQLSIDNTLSDSEDSIMGPRGADHESDDQLDSPSGPSDYDGAINKIE
ncbi:hypothetical protein BGZ74_006627, partial [Mortierella antarctica]